MYLQGLANAAVKNGAKIYEISKMSEQSGEEPQQTVTTEDGKKVKHHHLTQFTSELLQPIKPRPSLGVACLK